MVEVQEERLNSAFVIFSSKEIIIDEHEPSSYSRHYEW